MSVAVLQLSEQPKPQADNMEGNLPCAGGGDDWRRAQSEIAIVRGGREVDDAETKKKSSHRLPLLRK